VGREYRRRLKKAFDEAGIEIPVSPLCGDGAPAKPMKSRNKFHLAAPKIRSTFYFGPGVYIRSHPDRHLI
jgi:hypothetical protein